MRAAERDVLPDAERLAAAVATALLEHLGALQADGRTPHVVLTGGTVADLVHREVARLAPDSSVDFADVVFWFGDERFVAPDSEDRNERQARQAFLDAVGATQVHAVPSSATASSVEEAAEVYAATLREHGPDEIDVVMLGVGPDGHVASLFPDHPQLFEVGVDVVAVRDSPKPPPERVSLTFPALQRSTEVWFLVSGEGKADAVARALAGDEVRATPAAGVRGRRRTRWWLDRAAASRL
ncbi:6-phosphogluconolactonase [Nocardioides zeae]|uniref:6-phosphogluconolactonase n=1 Tax=Nocardioides imazamoxiresistens TaxID=3231893 RepID=A0ABU3PU47_9ACTN|nr:6-phosphogluconolactonase [Nocardioides zeae]MDT9592446.1 6-phosphogluconolactonase [Nocardioides zeae]